MQRIQLVTRYLKWRSSGVISVFLLLFTVSVLFNMNSTTKGSNNDISDSLLCENVDKLIETPNEIPANSPLKKLLKISGRKFTIGSEDDGGNVLQLQVMRIPLLNCLRQDNPYLVNLIRNEMMIQPNSLPYSLLIPQHCLYKFELWFSPHSNSTISGLPCSKPKCLQNGKEGEFDPVCAVTYSHTITDVLNSKVFGENVKNGFFIESGAYDSDISSPSLLFELKYNWTGLLIEPIPAPFYDTVRTNRKAVAINTCLATEDRPHYAELSMEVREINNQGRTAMMGIVGEKEKDLRGTDSVLKMQCMPFYSILLAAGNPTVNVWILDIEGAEFPVLKTVPWDLVDIEVLVVETLMAGELFPGSREDIIQYIKSKGYVHFYVHGGPKGSAILDDIFVSSKAVTKYNLSSVSINPDQNYNYEKNNAGLNQLI